MRRRTLSSLLALIAVAACSPANGAAKPDSAAVAADLQGVAKLRDAFAAGFKAGDISAITALYTSDGFTQGNFAPTGTGPEGLTAAYKAFLGQFKTVTSFTLTPVKTEVSGNLGYDIGTYSVAATAPNGDPIKQDGRYVVVLRKGADGTWKAIADMDNVTAMPAPPAPAPKAKAK